MQIGIAYTIGIELETFEATGKRTGARVPGVAVRTGEEDKSTAEQVEQR